MLTVTTSAKKKLKEALQIQTADLKIAIRIVSSFSNPNRLELVWDREKAGDQVVETEEGRKVLLIGSDLISVLEGMVIDCEETPEGTAFTISKVSPIA